MVDLKTQGSPEGDPSIVNEELQAEKVRISKILKYLVFISLGLFLMVSIFAGGVMVGWSLPGSPEVFFPRLPSGPSAILGPTETSSGSAAATPVDRDTLFKPFWEAWDIVKSQYVEQPVDEVKLMRGAIRGMIAALGDQHSSYMDPDQYRQQTTAIEGEYEGIGAWVDITGEFLTIISSMPNSPAEAAGLKTGDKVIAVDGQDMTGIDGNLVLKRILGPADTTVKLTIEREGQEIFEVEIKRAKIVVPSIETKKLDNNIAYIRLFTYGDKTTEELRTALKTALAEKPAGLVLDLRNNGGGLLNTAIEVVSEFLPADQIAMYEAFSDGSRRTFKTQRGGLATEIPLVVLVNEGTASASEITAGAIQDYGRGKLVGVTTFGKGSVQNWIALQNDQGAVRVTIARWLTPKDRQISKVGLEPDVVVEITEEDIKADRDPQLDKAVDLLKK